MQTSIVTTFFFFFRQSKLTVHTQRQMDLREHLYESTLPLARTPHKQCPVLPLFFHKVRLHLLKNLVCLQGKRKRSCSAVGGTKLEIKYFGLCVFPMGVQKVILALTYFCATVISDSKYASI